MYDGSVCPASLLRATSPFEDSTCTYLRRRWKTVCATAAFAGCGVCGFPCGPFRFTGHKARRIRVGRARWDR